MEVYETKNLIRPEGRGVDTVLSGPCFVSLSSESALRAVRSGTMRTGKKSPRIRGDCFFVLVPLPIVGVERQE